VAMSISSFTRVKVRKQSWKLRMRIYRFEKAQAWLKVDGALEGDLDSFKLTVGRFAAWKS